MPTRLPPPPKPEPKPEPEPKPPRKSEPQRKSEPPRSADPVSAPVASAPVSVERDRPARAGTPAQVANAMATASSSAQVEPALVEARFDADYLRNPAPVYPPMSRRRGEQGEVRLLVAVSAAGTPERVEIRHSSGYPRLDEAALIAVRQWQFMPALRGERPVSASVVVPIVFRLDG